MQKVAYFGNYAVGVSLYWYGVPQAIFSFAIVNEASGLLFEFGMFGAVVRLVICVARVRD